MKKALIILILISASAFNVDEGNVFKPGQSNIFFDMLYSTGKNIKEHFDGFIFLINTFYAIFTKQKIKSPERYQEEYPRLLQEEPEFEQDDESTIDENTYARAVVKSYIDKDGNEKYYVASETSPRDFTNHMEKMIYPPVNVTECQHGGVLHQVTYIAYNCSGKPVTKKQFEQQLQKPQSNCNRELVKGSICSCPRDYYGAKCEYSVSVYCGYTWVNPTIDKLQCNKSASDYKNIEYYDYSRYGIPPCIFLNQTRKYEFEIALECKSHPLAVEGVKNAKDYLLDPPETFNDNFTYWINTSSLAFSSEVLVITVLTFLNFNHISKTKQFVNRTNMTSDIIGNKTISFLVNFEEEEMMKLRVAGRWYFELVPTIPTLNEEGFNFAHVTRAVIDDGLYVEPLANKVFTWLEILLIVLGSLVAIAVIVVGFICYRRKKRKEESFIQGDD